MTNRKQSLLGFGLFAALLALWPIAVLAGDGSTFDRTFNVTGPVRLELGSGSGNAEIRGSADGKVHVRGTVTRGGWSLFGSSEKSVDEVVANPPLEQHDNTIRIGKSMFGYRNVSIEYHVEVPKDTEVDATVASGGLTVDNVRGPVKANSASGYVHVYRVERDANINVASGSIEVSTIGGVLRVTSASGDIVIADVKGDLNASAASGSIKITNASDRIEASSASGEINVSGANGDLKVHAVSGSIHVSGDPSTNHYWELKSVSGSVDLRVPANAGFLLSAEATSGDIRTGLPVIIEEQGKHSLRAHVGSSTGRVEVHTVSGAINVRTI
jgi:DUF4097 and DUF4098 domain-containing protein YvlB